VTLRTACGSVIDAMASVHPDVPRGRLITVEGVEGAGKSTQTERLRGWLAARGVAVVATAEPDGTSLGAGLRRLLGEVDRVEPLTEALLFAASRAEHVRRVIRPALATGTVVLCDRYVDSTTAYQGHGRGLALEVVAELNRLATDGVWPELTVVLDLDVGEGLRRARARRGAVAGCDPFERLALEFHERVRKGYWAIRDREPGRVVLVDADRPEPVVAAEIAAVVGARLGLGPA
jgi:dTMP kinase